MTAGDFINRGTYTLAAAGIASARLDCLILLEDALHLDRARIIAHPETKISIKTELDLNTKITQRSKHIPLAYLRGKAPFYGREFKVNTYVLVPRPETEAMISLLKTLRLPPSPIIADIGTGSGCLGITAALEIKGSHIHLYDIDQNALAIAQQNVKKFSVEASYHQGDLLEPYEGPFDVLLANLPYVPDNYQINQAAGHEPKLALFGGKDGLDIYRRFWLAAKTLRHPPLTILTESLIEQHAPMVKLASSAGYRLAKTDGLMQCFSLSQ